MQGVVSNVESNVRSLMYLRFAVNTKDQDSGRRLGLFHVIRELCEAKLVSAFEEQQLLTIRDWFNENLERPDAFTRSRKPHAKGSAISWFKDSAKEHLAKMYELVAILEAHGVGVEVIRTSRPGYVVYEDMHQVIAEPYADTQT